MAQGWLDQYRFDTGAGTVAGMLNEGASEAFLRIAVGLGSEEALALAETLRARIRATGCATRLGMRRRGG